MVRQSAPPAYPPRVARRHGTGLAIGSVLLLLLGVIVADRVIVSVPAIERPGRPAPVQTHQAVASAPVAHTPAARTPAAGTGARAISVGARAGEPAGAVPSAGAEAAAVVPVPAPVVAVVVRTTAKVWIGGRAPNGRLVFSRVMQPGDSWTPPRPDLSLSTGNAGGTELVVNGVVGSPLGASGTVLHGIPLNPAGLEAWRAEAARRDAAGPGGRRKHAFTSARTGRRGGRD